MPATCMQPTTARQPGSSSISYLLLQALHGVVCCAVIVVLHDQSSTCVPVPAAGSDVLLFRPVESERVLRVVPDAWPLPAPTAAAAQRPEGRVPAGQTSLSGPGGWTCAVTVSVVVKMW